MADIVALEQGERHWRFLDLDSGTIYCFGYDFKEGYLYCRLDRLPAVPWKGDTGEGEDSHMLELASHDEAGSLLNTLRRRCQLGPVELEEEV